MSAPFAIPVGLNPTAVGVSVAWWIEAARRAQDAGFATAWIWDHFMSRGDLDDSLLECWTTLTAAAVSTDSIGVGSFVTNNVNRHPALLAAIVSTLADVAPGRVELGIGIGGHPAEHEAYGIDFPPAQERAQRLEEAITVLRLLFAGGPADFDGRYYQLREAHSFPAPNPVPRIIVAGERAAGARLAARAGDAWTCSAERYEELRPVFDAALVEAGRASAQMGILVGIDHTGVVEPLAELTARWAEAGATELIIHDADPDEMDRILDLV